MLLMDVAVRTTDIGLVILQGCATETRNSRIIASTLPDYCESENRVYAHLLYFLARAAKV